MKPREGPTSPKGRAKAARKRERDTARFEKHFHSEERVLFVKRLPCVRCGKRFLSPWMVHVHHDPTKAAGGTYKDTSPVCGICHTLGGHARHTVGVETFWAEVGMSYAASNAATQAAWLAYSEGLVLP